MEYARNVVLKRAVPALFDGLKPVHRRLLYAMHQLKLSPEHGFKKCARVVGDVIGKYHPHGDAAIYDAMVRMAQDFAMNSPLIDGQGNWGSPDGDKAAANRYTEARLTHIAKFLLEDYERSTVNFEGNYDDTLMMPSVLPARTTNSA